MQEPRCHKRRRRQGGRRPISHPSGILFIPSSSTSLILWRILWMWSSTRFLLRWGLDNVTTVATNNFGIREGLGLVVHGFVIPVPVHVPMDRFSHHHHHTRKKIHHDSSSRPRNTADMFLGAMSSSPHSPLVNASTSTMSSQPRKDTDQHSSAHASSSSSSSLKFWHSWTTPPATVLIHWKGEDTEGYSIELRHLEWEGAVTAIVQALLEYGTEPPPPTSFRVTFTYTNALHYDTEGGNTGRGEGDDPYNGYMPPHKQDLFNQALQYVHIQIEWNNHNYNPTVHPLWDQLSLHHIRQATARCSLIHATYWIVGHVPLSDHDRYEAVGRHALQQGYLSDLQPGNVHEQDS